jgi:hypothetical protein
MGNGRKRALPNQTICPNANFVSITKHELGSKFEELFDFVKAASRLIPYH